jgi:hypothetical protein
MYGAKLVMAKIDRLSRDALFLLGLEKADVDFVAADSCRTLNVRFWHKADVQLSPPNVRFQG